MGFASHPARPALHDGQHYLLGVMGFPVAHSLSPRFHNRALAQQNLDGHYYAWPVPPENLGRSLEAVRTLPVHGVSITLPHKQACLALLDSVDARSARIGAVNTLYWDTPGLCGTNTDVSGFEQALKPYLQAKPHTAFVLGAGGAACAVLVALQQLGVQKIYLANRNAARAEELASRLHLPESPIQVCPWEQRAERQEDFLADIVINTTSLGMQGAQCTHSPLEQDVWKRNCWHGQNAHGAQRIACDIVYTPTSTVFLQNAACAGWQCVDGMSMFVAQACTQFALWTGIDLHKKQARDFLAEDAVHV